MLKPNHSYAWFKIGRKYRTIVISADVQLWVTVTANQSFIRFHGRNTKGHYWYNYLYSEQELKPWIEKVKEIREQTKILRIYFNNHYGGKAVVNAMQFKEMIGLLLSTDEKRVMANAKGHILGN